MLRQSVGQLYLSAAQQALHRLLRSHQVTKGILEGNCVVANTGALLPEF
jgi:hypothetical protein